MILKAIKYLVKMTLIGEICSLLLPSLSFYLSPSIYLPLSLSFPPIFSSSLPCPPSFPFPTIPFLRPSPTFSSQKEQTSKLKADPPFYDRRKIRRRKGDKGFSVLRSPSRMTSVETEMSPPRRFGDKK